MNSTTVNLLNAGLWILIVFLAFFMQVMPFLLVLTLINISFGVSSEVALILIPVVLFGMLVGGCVYASGRARNKLPAPLPVYRTDSVPEGLKGLATCMLPHSRRYRMW
ncbi:MAG: hypothetical protein ACPGQV_15705 [Alphaproteobacteria bacterium]